MGATAIRPVLRQRARSLRRGPTRAERRLWRALRQLNRLGAAHFRRQAPLGPYIVDFADLGRRLVIEVDGGQHGGLADAARDAWLKREGFLVLRFWNNDVLQNTGGVLDTITRTLSERPRHRRPEPATADAAARAAPPHPHPIPPPQGGREPPEPDAGPGGPERSLTDGPEASPPPCGEGMGVGLRRRRRARHPAPTASVPAGGRHAED